MMEKKQELKELALYTVLLIALMILLIVIP